MEEGEDVGVVEVELEFGLQAELVDHHVGFYCGFGDLFYRVEGVGLLMDALVDGAESALAEDPAQCEVVD